MVLGWNIVNLGLTRTTSERTDAVTQHAVSELQLTWRNVGEVVNTCVQSGAFANLKYRLD